MKKRMWLFGILVSAVVYVVIMVSINTRASTAAPVTSRIATNGETISQADVASAGQYYGVDGFHVIGDVQQYPAYARVTTARVESTIVWANSTTDVRALERAHSADRVAAAWSTSQTSFDVDIEITDGQAHQVALYFLDFDSQSRVQRLAVIPMNGEGTLADYRLIDSFSGGVYLTYNIAGHIKFRVWRESAADAVLSGIFFQPVGVPPAPPSPTPTPAPTVSPSPTATPTPTPPTPAPTATPTPVAAPSPSPSPTPCKRGSWLGVVQPDGRCKRP